MIGNREMKKRGSPGLIMALSLFSWVGWNTKRTKENHGGSIRNRIPGVEIPIR